jgi:hypothetical protein
MERVAGAFQRGLSGVSGETTGLGSDSGRGSSSSHTSPATMPSRAESPATSSICFMLGGGARLGSSVTYGHQSRMYEKISGATIVASDSIMKRGVVPSSLPHVIFSFGTAPE